jgi:RNA polymerase sigma-70 factor, ECF subfamily
MGDVDDATTQALEQLYRMQYPRFLRLALAVLGEREAAADAVQEAFIRALRGRRGIRDPAALEAWVWRTVLNTALSHRAAAASRPSAPLDGVEQAAANGHAQAFSELRAAVAALPERQRLVIFLRHYADLDYERIADVLEIARGTVAATLSQAHAALRRTIEVPR